MSTSHTKRDEQNRRDIILVIVLVFVCVALFGIGSLFSQDIKQVSILSNFGGGGSQSTLLISPPPSATPLPTVTPTPTLPTMKNQAVKPPSKNPAASTGLGIGLAELLTAFEKESFQFSNTTENVNQIHSLGKTPDGLAAVELSGTIDDIHSAAVVTYLAADKPEHLENSLKYMAQMIKIVLPSWKDGTKWLYTAVGQLATSKIRPQEIETISLNIRINLKMMDSPSLIIISMEPAPVK